MNINSKVKDDVWMYVTYCLPNIYIFNYNDNIGQDILRILVRNYSANSKQGFIENSQNNKKNCSFVQRMQMVWSWFLCRIKNSVVNCNDMTMSVIILSYIQTYTYINVTLLSQNIYTYLHLYFLKEDSTLRILDFHLSGKSVHVDGREREKKRES